MRKIMDDVFLTKQGLEALKEELEELVNEKRPALVQRLTLARDMGDLSENSDYTSAKEELAIIDGRIEELQDILHKAKVITNKHNNADKQVVLGCQVTVKVDSETHVYTVVGEWEADPVNKKISHQSPLGKALLGKKVGDKVEIEAPAGKILYHIKEIH
jgi:transcription elongation factor GreA